MAARSAAAALDDIIEAFARVRLVLGDVGLDAFEADWQRQWLVERGVEIISEASRRLPAEMKARHPRIPWTKVAAIGNVLRHEYARVSAPLMWKLAMDDLPVLVQACRAERDAMVRPGGDA